MRTSTRITSTSSAVPMRAMPPPPTTAMKVVIATPDTWRQAAFGSSSTLRAAMS